VAIWTYDTAAAATTMTISSPCQEDDDNNQKGVHAFLSTLPLIWTKQQKINYNIE